MFSIYCFKFDFFWFVYSGREAGICVAKNNNALRGSSSCANGNKNQKKNHFNWIILFENILQGGSEVTWRALANYTYAVLIISAPTVNLFLFPIVFEIKMFHFSIFYRDIQKNREHRRLMPPLPNAKVCDVVRLNPVFRAPQ